MFSSLRTTGRVPLPPKPAGRSRRTAAPTGSEMWVDVKIQKVDGARPSDRSDRPSNTEGDPDGEASARRNDQEASHRGGLSRGRPVCWPSRRFGHAPAERSLQLLLESWRGG